MPMLKAGEMAPDFTATAHTGESITLSNLRGKWVVLWFYPMADTPG
jgi:thioredoxin-dependent peroxiredoxin